MNNYIIVFKNTHDAIQAEKILKEQGESIMVMPTPTCITKSCGISIRFNEGILSKVENLIKEEKIVTKNIYVKNGQEFKLYR
ncbi:DUF3343 domain-containing protein [Clostridium fallax]|uniref:Putative Se/S carrier protein-like domain-containing protein n=1 Tax=Clostridium fallax TaxID=1533 RepID=A0A1M4X247_9CLOT|nr:DUF3343 domain-containing protein [Clostridium fallax]SHE87520.1 Protein of unknown function [Clostridium fallax]SQB22543.1 Protein of uncharacterised function (DUF3343) [Clostridium fallax]